MCILSQSPVKRNTAIAFTTEASNPIYDLFHKLASEIALVARATLAEHSYVIIWYLWTISAQ